MDPISHGIVGAAIGAAGGLDVSLTNPYFLATIMGAVSPDLDIVYQCWGDWIYLKHHRGFSHSLPGLFCFAFLTGGILSLLFPASSFFMLFFWALVGTLSHTFLDLLNSYGVMLLYPFSRKKYTLNLLMITDPFLLLGGMAMVFCGYYGWPFLYLALILLISYLIIRLFMRRRAERLIRHYYGGYLTRLVVMPAFIGIVKWDFIATVQNKNIVGQINLLNCKITVYKKLKLISEEIIEKLEQTKIGKIFREFTPLFHIEYFLEGNKIIGRFIDLRYFVKNRFLHHGTVIMDKKSNVVEKELFQPYSPNNSIEIN